METKRPYLVGITGGIGAGKSVVARIVASMGYPVYDTDCEAKRIMCESDVIKNALICHFGENAVIGECINNRHIASSVFGNSEALTLLNGIVHPHVIRDVKLWNSRQVSPVTFVESAILYQCGLDTTVDEVWIVEADIETRIRRVMARSGLTADEVRRRIASQSDGIARHHDRERTLINDDKMPLVSQILHLLKNLQI